MLVIEDKQILGEFVIEIDDKQYSLVQNIPFQQGKMAEEGKFRKVYHGHYTDLSKLLIKIAKLKLIKEHEMLDLYSYMTLLKTEVESLKLFFENAGIMQN